jgi:hypothetical protein
MAEKYFPDPPPIDIQEIPAYLEDQLIKMQDALSTLHIEIIMLDPIIAEPDKPRETMLVWAEGATGQWKAGAPGLYFYRSGAWVGPVS